eukprot:RCo014590
MRSPARSDFPPPPKRDFSCFLRHSTMFSLSLFFHAVGFVPWESASPIPLIQRCTNTSLLGFSSDNSDSLRVLRALRFHPSLVRSRTGSALFGTVGRGGLASQCSKLLFSVVCLSKKK